MYATTDLERPMTDTVLAIEERATPPSRGRGRPRLVDVDERILEAAIDELCENGVAAFAFERVAAQAGVARTTVYRRWPTKTDLIVGAIELLRVRSIVPDTGDLRADLIVGIDNVIRIFASPQGKAIVAVLTAATQNDELTAAMYEKVLTPFRAAFRVVLERAVEADQVCLTLSMDETISVMTSIAFTVHFGGAVELHAGLAAGVVDTVLRGIAPRAQQEPA